MVDKQNKSLEELDKDNIAGIFYGLVDSIKKEVIDSNQYKYFKDRASSFSLCRDEIYSKLMSPYKTCLDLYIRDRLEKEGISKDKLGIYTNILLYYDFYKIHIKKLISKKYGYPCCVDKTSTIIKEYLYFLRTGEKRYDLKNKYVCYSILKDYDPDFWFDLIEGLYHLKYGNPTKYLRIFSIYCLSFSNMEKADDSK